MFLFSNAPVGTRDTGASAGSRAAGTAAGSSTGAATGTGGAVIEAIRDGAQSTGVGFDYLLATARRESGLDPKAKAATSSASGLFQFIEQTWLGTMKAAGAKLGLSSYAEAITARSDGRYGVSDAATRQAILDLRGDPRVSAAMAGALTQRNRDALSAALGREPTGGDLYAAHVLGAKGAASLIASAQGSPARTAALDLPEAASANRGLFYDRSGRARSASELYALLAAGPAGGRPAAAGASAAASGPETGLPEPATAYASLDTSLRSLFQTDRRQGSVVQGSVVQGSVVQGTSAQGAVSAGVAKLWQNRGTAANAVPGYFPRSEAVQASARDTVPEPETTSSISAATAASATTAALEPVVVPLPPRRPAEFSGTGRAAADAAAGTAVQTNAAARSADLIDFSSYVLRNGP